MRRLQHLVAASTGADGDLEGEEDTAMPSTMKPAKGKSKKAKQRTTNAGEVPGGAEKSEDVSTANEPAHPAEGGPEPTATDLPTGQTNKAKDKPTAKATADGDGSEAGEASASPEPASSSAAAPQPVASPTTSTQSHNPEEGLKAERKQHHKREAKKLKKQREEEEEALLQAALEKRLEHDGDGGFGVVYGSGEGAAVGSAHALGVDTLLLNFMTRADATRLDMRMERIRNFGPEAVEDVGDGSVPRYRADGQRSDTGSTSFFPEHGMKLKFRPCALATPNRYRWPPYDSLGLVLKVVPRPEEPLVYRPARGEPEAMQYVLDVDVPAFRRADEARALCVAMHGPIQGLIDCLGEHGCYHIPTLLQVSQSFEVTGNTAHAQELIDLALYNTGMLLSHVRIEATWQQRQLSASFESNRLLLTVLMRGVHVALRRGCTRTAWEMSKLLLSLDATDPEGVLLQLDYTALRAKRWVWLVRVYLLAHRRLHEGDDCAALLERLGRRSGAEAADALPTLTQREVVGTLAVDVCRLPGFAFSAALAKHFLEREAAREGQAGNGPAYRSKVLREMTAEERDILASAPSAEKLLATAIATFPAATHCLIEALQGAEAVCRGATGPLDECWVRQLAPQARAVVEAPQGDFETMTSRLAEAFAARHADMWKAQETMSFLRMALTHAPETTAEAQGEPPRSTSWLAAALAETATTRALWVTPMQSCSCVRPRCDPCSIRNYSSRSKDEVLGSAGTAIPQDLLAQLQAPDEEHWDEVGENQVRRALAGRRDQVALDELEQDLLLRFEALYGALDPGQFPTERRRLDEYRSRLSREDAMRQVLGAMNPLELFVRTLLPWNSSEEMVLRDLLQARGIEDPIRRREAEGRQADARMWDEDEAAAEAAEDSDADWVSMHSDKDDTGSGEEGA